MSGTVSIGSDGDGTNSHDEPGDDADDDWSDREQEFGLPSHGSTPRVRKTGAPGTPSASRGKGRDAGEGGFAGLAAAVMLQHKLAKQRAATARLREELAEQRTATHALLATVQAHGTCNAVITYLLVLRDCSTSFVS